MNTMPPAPPLNPFWHLPALQEGLITEDTIKDSTRLFHLGRYALIMTVLPEATAK